MLGDVRAAHANAARDEAARTLGYKDYNDRLAHDCMLNRVNSPEDRLTDVAREKIIASFKGCFGD